MAIFTAVQETLNSMATDPRFEGIWQDALYMAQASSTYIPATGIASQTFGTEQACRVMRDELTHLERQDTALQRADTAFWLRPSDIATLAPTTKGRLTHNAVTYDILRVMPTPADVTMRLICARASVGG